MTDRTITSVPKGHLEIVAGPDQGLVVEAGPERQLVIGRKASCDLVLSDEAASREHAVVESTPRGFRVRDEKSTNGTWIGGHAVGPAGVLLEDGDEVVIGRTVIRFRADPPDPSRTRPTSPPDPPVDFGSSQGPSAAPESAAAGGRGSEPAIREHLGETDRDQPSPSPKETFGPFGIVRHLGTEGGCESLMAVDSRTRQPCELLRVPAGSTGFFGRRRFLQGCEVARGLQHSSLLAPIDCGRSGSWLYVATPWRQMVSLARLLRQAPRPIPIELALFVAAELAGALAAAAAGPAGNVPILLDDQRVGITVDGAIIVRLAGVLPVETTDGAVRRHSAPEEDMGTRDPRSALFSIGALLWELLTGEPIDPTEKTTLRNVETLRVGVPDEVSRVTMQALEVRPDDRQRNAGILEADLTAALRRASPGYGAAQLASWLAATVPGL